MSIFNTFDVINKSLELLYYRNEKKWMLLLQIYLDWTLFSNQKTNTRKDAKYLII